MDKRLLALAAAAVLGACGSAPATGDEAGGASAAGSAAQKGFALAGLDLRMTGLEAAAALRRSGWNVKRDLGYDWDAHVSAELRRQRNDPAFVEKRPGLGDVYADKGDEKLEVILRPSPRGGSIDTIRYKAPLNGRSLEQTGSELVGRYGRASAGSAGANGFDLRWCEARRCDASSSELTAVASTSTGQLVVTLVWGRDRHAAWDREVAAAMAAKSGAIRRSF